MSEEDLKNAEASQVGVKAETENPGAEPAVKKMRNFYRHKECTCTGNRFTVAVIPSGEKKVRIGVAICSERETFSRKVGRELAEKRARELPFATMEVNMAVDTYDAALIALNTIAAFIEANPHYAMKQLNKARGGDPTDHVDVKMLH